MSGTSPSSTSKEAQTTPAAAAAAAASSSPSLDQLPALHEDDEFEEFASQDWDDSATYSNVLASKSAQTAAGGPAAATATAAAGTEAQQQQQKQGLDSLWQDNWDDDDVEDDFSVALREQLRKQDQMQL
ncbi:BZ3500_MvSof-1268-A1-R1_Chr11-2g03405 [Microbotryum saponariae]|uniref:26S proteasome complex subunit SEM1 n=1 Tax=Microbotryum saponariae TaxID=289078 RepID=A0A2X0MS24_9BASI|nr:BZ3500_MvSof-1268-A1-R1_Chr11-2g03405 [Microbotryum saponariae]SDA03307.1 BZ3501_MvSof-1269-A2-R1_Chr11g02976 [Microbotryum saponariae]